MLKALLLLLQLTDNGSSYFTSPTATSATAATGDDDKDDDNVTYDNEGMISQAPLVPILRRVAEIPSREIKRYNSRKKVKKDENSVSKQNS